MPARVVIRGADRLVGVAARGTAANVIDRFALLDRPIQRDVRLLMILATLLVVEPVDRALYGHSKRYHTKNRETASHDFANGKGLFRSHQCVRQRSGGCEFDQGLLPGRDENVAFLGRLAGGNDLDGMPAGRKLEPRRSV